MVGDAGTSHIEDPAQPSPIDAHPRWIARELPRRQHVHRHAGGSNWMPFGLEAPRQVHRQTTSQIHITRTEHVGTTPRCGEAHRLVLHQFGNGETIMRLHEIKIIDRQIRGAQCLAPCLGTTRQLCEIAP